MAQTAVDIGNDLPGILQSHDVDAINISIAGLGLTFMGG